MDVNRYGGGGSINSNMASYLPLVYAGHPNRIQRYYQFDDMDRDSDINAALDTIADFCTQSEEQTDEPFEIHYNSDPNESETKIVKTMLERWTKLNSFKSRLWYMFRDCIKNGDAFFLRDPETQEWLWLDHFMVEMVKVDDTMGKKPEEYLVRGLDYNRQAHYGTKKADPNQYRSPYGTSNVGASRIAAVAPASAPAAFSLAGTASDPRQRHMLGPFAQEVSVIDAQFVVHLSLSIGNDINWPFGASILEPIFKTFKQKELLEDAIIIYRVQRAPERRIFYIDTGTMPPERAKRHIESIKNDIHQRRIPNRTGTGGCFDLATKVPLLDGRTLSIAELTIEHEAGKQNWAYSCNPVTGEIVPGKITWAGTTRRNAEVMKLTLDNGQTIVCTPEHQYPVVGKGMIKAKDIQIDVDQLFGFDKTHKIFAIEYLPETIDVGTLTIDGKEEFHNFHTFALEQGVFTKNSILDAAYNPLCISLDTRIPLLDGRVLSLHDLIEEFEAGRNNWVYSVDPDTGKLTTGPIDWAGITREDAEVVEVVLDNGKSFIVTPDHSIPVLGKGFVEAKDLTPTDPLIRFNREDGVCQYIAEVVRLKDRMTVGTITVDHAEKHHPFHTFAIAENIFLKNSINDDYFFSQCCKLATLVPLLDGRTLSFAEIIEEHERGKINYTYSLNLETHELEPGRIAWAGVTRRNAELVRVHLDNGEHIDVTPDHRFILRDGKERQAGALQPDDSLMPLYLLEGRTGPRQKNAGYTRYVCNSRGSKTKFVHSTMCPKPPGREWVVHHKDFNGKNNNPDNLEVMRWDDHERLHKETGTYSLGRWGDFKQNYAKNHKVVAVEWLSERDDTGDITVESPSGSHVFALAAGVYVHNSQDGRGSKVETLPGGELTGEIGDLMFFSRKLARGLRIPVSYLNLGEDEGNNNVTFNDGKLGAAMIQEFRFSKFCTRLQSLLAPIFDKEFKRFLQKNGIEIEWSLFELRFAPPQSFTRYRQIELDTQRVGVYSSVSENRRLSERFKFKKYLGLTEDEMIENEKLWSEENAAKLKQKVGASPAESEGGEGLGAVGIHPGDEMPPEMPAEGEAGMEGMAGGEAGMPGAAAPAAPAGSPAAGGAGMPGPAV